MSSHRAPAIDRMVRTPAPAPSATSTVGRYGLLGAALTVALLGLTAVDGGPRRAKEKPHRVDERSAECIVASAVFAGVHPVAPSPLP